MRLAVLRVRAPLRWRVAPGSRVVDTVDCVVIGAGVVGLASVYVWGFEGGELTEQLAIKRGIAETKKGKPVLLEFITKKETTISRHLPEA